MLCQKKLIIGFGIFLSVFVSVLLSSSCYAIDPTGIIDSSVSNFGICSNDSTVVVSDNLCSDYTYIIFDVVNLPDPYNTDRYIALSFPQYGSYRSPRINFTPSLTIISIDNIAYIKIINTYNIGNGSMRWTLTNTLPSSGCPEPEEPECPAIPENPYDEKLDNITMAIYCCGGILLVLYFFYCIYRVIIKSSGVDRL